MLEEDRALAEIMLVESDGLIGPAQELGQEAFPILDGSVPQVVAVKLDQIEGTKQGGMVMVPVAQ